jgi:hypothetical protein
VGPYAFYSERYWDDHQDVVAVVKSPAFGEVARLRTVGMVGPPRNGRPSGALLGLFGLGLAEDLAEPEGDFAQPFARPFRALFE